MTNKNKNQVRGDILSRPDESNSVVLDSGFFPLSPPLLCSTWASSCGSNTDEDLSSSSSSSVEVFSDDLITGVVSSVIVLRPSELPVSLLF